MNGTPVTWRATPRLRRLAAVAATAVAAAAVTGHAPVLLLAAPALAALAVGSERRPPATLGAGATVSADRCFEGEPVEVIASVAGPVDETTFHLVPGPGVRLMSGPATHVVVGSTSPRARWVLTPQVWGRRPPCAVTLQCRVGGTWQANLAFQPAPCEVFPHPPPASATLLPADLLRRLGEHTARVPGAGTEFHGIRGYVPGDRLRDVNWAVSSRLGGLHVNQRSAVRAADLVVMIDAFSEAGPAGQTTLDLSVRGAAGLAAAYLQASDRVGVVTLGGMLRWLGPAPGERQFFRIAEMTLDVRFASHVTPDIQRVPRTALPPGALAVLFSPLLDQRAIDAITDLRQRGISLVVVDVLRHEPPAQPREALSALALRVWRLERRALRAGLTRLGVPVLDWADGTSLDATLSPLHGRPLPAMRP